MRLYRSTLSLSRQSAPGVGRRRMAFIWGLCSLSPKFSVVYYSSGRVPEGLKRYCLGVLVRVAAESGGEVLCVTWEPVDCPGIRNIVWRRHVFSHLNMYQQILAGAAEAASDVVMLAEHDVLYPRAYHHAMAAASGGGLCYNTNIWRLSRRGFFRPDQCRLLSNCSGTRVVILQRIEEKLSEIRNQGRVVWAEPAGDVEISSPFPTVDVRHGRNFTGDREARDGQYVDGIEYWGQASQYTRLFDGGGE